MERLPFDPSKPSLSGGERMVKDKKQFGGQGSGNWGHAGRPGEVGGSAPGGGGGSRAAGNPYEIGETDEEEAKFRKNVEDAIDSGITIKARADRNLMHIGGKEVTISGWDSRDNAFVTVIDEDGNSHYVHTSQLDNVHEAEDDDEEGVMRSGVPAGEHLTPEGTGSGAKTWQREARLRKELKTVSDRQHNGMMDALANDEAASDKELENHFVKNIGVSPAVARYYVGQREKVLTAMPGDPILAWRGPENPNATAGDWKGKKEIEDSPFSRTMKPYESEKKYPPGSRVNKDGSWYEKTDQGERYHEAPYSKKTQDLGVKISKHQSQTQIKSTLKEIDALRQKGQLTEKEHQWLQRSADGRMMEIEGKRKAKVKPKQHSQKEMAMIRAKDFTIFKAGHWNGETFTESDLDEMVKSFDSNEPIPIIVGHSSDYRGHTRIPAFGRIMGGLKRVGQDLIACGVEFNEKLAQWIKDGFYNQRSIELTRDNRRVLALGMLGAVPPAVKGLPGNDDALTEVAMQFSEDNRPKVIEFQEEVEPPEMEEPEETEIPEGNGSSIDEAEQMGIDDTFKNISESCARFLEDIEEMLEGGEKAQRLVQEVYELEGDLMRHLTAHGAFMEKLESIEESQENEYSQRPGWKQFVKRVKSIFSKRKEQDEMDKQKEQEYNERIEELEAKVKEFQDAEDDAAIAKAKAEADEKAKVEAEAKAKADAEAAAAEEANATEVKELCDRLIKENRMTPAMRAKDEPIMLELRKKDEAAFKSFAGKYTTAVVPLGTEPALNDNSQKPSDGRPLVIRQADAYCKAHPKEFAGMTSDQAISRALYAHSIGQIKFEDNK